MKRTAHQEDRKQLGIKIPRTLWNHFRALAAKKNTTATSLLEESLKETLRKHGEKI